MKCCIAGCDKEFSMIYESHLIIDDQPLVICFDHIFSVIRNNVEVDFGKAPIAKRCR